MWPAVKVQDGLWRRTSSSGGEERLSELSIAPELTAVDRLFEEALGGTNGLDPNAVDTPDVDAFEYTPEGLRLSYSLRTVRRRRRRPQAS